MPCYHPIIRLTDKGMKKMSRWGRFLPLQDEQYLYQHGFTQDDFQKISCGQCIGCRLKNSREWATRCVLEAKEYPEDYNFAVTLTYDPLLIDSPVRCINRDTGEVFEKFMLNPDHLQKFMKDLRIYFQRYFDHTGIRFFACGEYGDKNARPHFHVLLFNCPVSDLVKSDRMTPKASKGVCYESPMLSQIWGKGLVCVNKISWHMAAYVARYQMKKLKGIDKKLRDELYDFNTSDGQWQDEFVRMSRRPGIAYAYFERNKDLIFDTDSVVCMQGDKVLTTKPPRYFDKMLEDYAGPFFEDRKEERQAVAIAARMLEMESVDMSEVEFLESQERIKQEQIKSLVRL